jgi:Asp-tRNA(Asn)/Glu-tRNA(Gln) amidotransferase A subunit family amidase
MGIADIVSKIRTGEVGLLEYLSSLCDRIDSEDPRINALVPETYERTRILNDASRLLKKYPAPSTLPALFGVPVGVKDIFRVEGFPTRCGSKLPAELFDGPETTCVTRLRSAGAIIMGKTVTTEFAYFEPGPTRNPRNPEHSPGGSSSGSAAGVASGFFPFALGTQTVGSIIRPAAYCGIVGFKPSYGRVSTSGVIPFSPSADHVGIFCSDSSGVGVLMPVLADEWQSPEETNASEQVVAGVPEGPYLAQATAGARDHFERQLRKLIEAGFKIKRIKAFAHIEEVNENHNSMIAREMASVHSTWFKEFRNLYRPRTIEIIEKGLRVSDEELGRLCLMRVRFRKDVEMQMESERIDMWICPAATDHAPRGLESTGSPVMNLPWTHAGLPSITLPAGTDRASLPQGIQCIGRYLKDEELMAAARGLTDILSN